MKNILTIFCLLALTACGQRTPKNTTAENASTGQEVKAEVATETAKSNKTTPQLLQKGSVITLRNNRGDEISFTFKDITTRKLRDGRYNLVLEVLIKNGMESDLMVTDLSWKLTDADKVEIDEAGVYDSFFDDVMPNMFDMTIVEAGFGKVDKVGYKVGKGKYYLYILGTCYGEIVVE